MKDARKLFRKTGTSMMLFLLGFSFIIDIVINPIGRKLWGLALTTTPDGYILSKNLLPTLLRAPWIILIALVFLLIKILFLYLQLVFLILGIGYAENGQTPWIRDLLKVSFKQVKKAVRKENLPMVLYVVVLLPLANVIAQDDIIGSFTIPEFIEDFIMIRPALVVLCLLAFLALSYLMLRLFFLLPAFVLGTQEFKAAKQESIGLTGKGWLRNGIRIAVFNIIETVRIGLIPVALILIPVLIAYLKTEKAKFAVGIFNTFGLLYGTEIVRNITISLVSISSLCFLVSEYRKKRIKAGKETVFELPPLPTKRRRTSDSILRLTVVVSLVFSLFITGSYLGLLKAAQNNSEVILELFRPTEIIAHKGYSSKAPENTMPAFRLADECKTVDLIELDVWSTKDGIPVVIHNRSIEEATGIDKNVTDCTYEELKKYPAPYAMDPKQFPDAVICSLEEVIKTYAESTPLLIEIKGYPDDPELPAKIVALMQKYNCMLTSKVQSGNYDALKAVKMIDPDITCGLILLAGIGDFQNLPYADFFSMEHTLIDIGLVNRIHKCRKSIYAWTVNHSSNADKLKFSGVDGLITDYPEKVNQYVSDTNRLLQDVISGQLESLLDFTVPEEDTKTLEESNV